MAAASVTTLGCDSSLFERTGKTSTHCGPRMALKVLRISSKLLSTYLLPKDNTSQPIRGQKGNLGWWERPDGAAVDTLIWDGRYTCLLQFIQCPALDQYSRGVWSRLTVSTGLLTGRKASLSF